MNKCMQECTPDMVITIISFMSNYKYNYKSRAIAGRTARCRCKFQEI